MKPIFAKTVTNIKITKEEKETLLKADKILDDIYNTLYQNDLENDLDNEMKELLEALEEINSIEEIVNVYLTWD